MLWSRRPSKQVFKQRKLPPISIYKWRWWHSIHVDLMQTSFWSGSIAQTWAFDTCPMRDRAFLTQFLSLKRHHGKERKKGAQQLEDRREEMHVHDVTALLSYWSTMKTSLLLHIFHSWFALMMTLLLQEPVHPAERAESTLSDCSQISVGSQEKCL